MKNILFEHLHRFYPKFNFNSIIASFLDYSSQFVSKGSFNKDGTDFEID